jgi:hypothetical protein
VIVEMVGYGLDLSVRTNERARRGKEGREKEDSKSNKRRSDLPSSHIYLSNPLLFFFDVRSAANCHTVAFVFLYILRKHGCGCVEMRTVPRW